jgi:hypothetical protein
VSSQRIVDSIMANNQPPIPADKVLGFRSRRAAEEYLAAHPDGALGGLHFYRSGERAMSYIVQANTTVRSSSSSRRFSAAAACTLTSKCQAGSCCMLCSVPDQPLRSCVPACMHATATDVAVCQAVPTAGGCSKLLYFLVLAGLIVPF